MPLTNVHSRWTSGNLLFYEADNYGADSDILKIATDAVTIGSTTQDTDFKWYGTGSVSFILDVGESSMTLVGCNVSIDGDIEITTDDIAVDQGYYVYFDGLLGGESIRSDTEHYLAIKATTGIDLMIGSTDEVNLTAAALTMATNNLILTAGEFSVAQGHYVYLDGQSGGEYVRSDTADDLMLNATTNLNLAIGGTDVVRLNSSRMLLVSTAQIQFAGANQYIYCSSADTLAINSGTTMNFSIADTTEMSLNANTFAVTGANFSVGADAAGKVARFYSNTADYNVAWSPSGDSNKGVWYFGSGTKGVDVWFQSQGGAYVLWDASEAAFMFVGEAKLDFTTSGTGTYEIRLKNNVADALSFTAGGNDFIVFTTTTAGPEVTFHQRLNLIGNTIDMDTNPTGSYAIRLASGVADALSVEYGGTDVFNINTTIPIVNFVSLVRFYGTNPANRGALFPPAINLELGDDTSYIVSPSVGHVKILAAATDGDALALYTGTGGSVQLANCYLNLFNSPGTDGDTNGDIWYDTVSNSFKGRANGATVSFNVT